MRVDDDAELMERFRSGDQAAAAQLCKRYVTKLVALAQRRLSVHLARRIDAEDVVQSAFRSFFHGTRNGRFQIESGEDLWQLLAVMTITKLKKQIEFHTAQKRDFQLERSPSSGEPRAGFAEKQAPAPSVEDSLALVEQIEQIATQLGVDQQRIFALRLEGHQLGEIAASLGFSERTVGRVLEKIKRLLRKQAEAAGGGENLSLLQP